MMMKRLLWAALAAFFIGQAQAAEVNDLNIVDSSNTARFPEGMSPGDVNDSARALEGILARWHKDGNCSTSSTGSSNTYALAANQTFTAYYDGMLLCFDANFSNTGAATLNVDSLGAKTIKKFNDQDLDSGDIESGQKILVVYDGTNFQLLSAVSAGNLAVTNANNNFSADQTIASTDAGASEGPALDLHRNSASPAVSDAIGAVRFKGEDTTSAETTYAKLGPPVILDPNDGTEDAEIPIATVVAGTLANRVHIGQGLYVEGNTDPGAGKIDADDFLISGTPISERSWRDQLATPQATTSGTTKDFTAPFSNIRQIVVMLNGVSTNGNGEPLIQIGTASTPLTTGYDGRVGTSGGTAYGGEGFELFTSASNSHVLTGVVRLSLLNASTNIWTAHHTLFNSQGGGTAQYGTGIVTLSGALNIVRLTTDDANTFDAGSVNVLWNGY